MGREDIIDVTSSLGLPSGYEWVKEGNSKRLMLPNGAGEIIIEGSNVFDDRVDMSKLEKVLSIGLDVSKSEELILPHYKPGDGLITLDAYFPQGLITSAKGYRDIIGDCRMYQAEKTNEGRYRLVSMKGEY